MIPKSILAFSESWVTPVHKFYQNLRILSEIPDWTLQLFRAEDHLELINRFQIEYLPAIVIYVSEEEFQLFDGNSLLKPINFYIRKFKNDRKE